MIVTATEAVWERGKHPISWEQERVDTLDGLPLRMYRRGTSPQVVEWMRRGIKVRDRKPCFFTHVKSRTEENNMSGKVRVCRTSAHHARVYGTRFVLVTQGTRVYGAQDRYPGRGDVQKVHPWRSWRLHLGSVVCKCPSAWLCSFSRYVCWVIPEGAKTGYYNSATSTKLG